jgi:tetratricopeptide (TPR) repeat protein
VRTTNYLIILFCFLGSLVCAQDLRALDSLNAAFKKAGSDSTKIKIKVELGYKWKFVNPDSTLILMKEALAISEKAGDEFWHAKALSATGFAYASVADYDEAIKKYQEAIKIFESLDKSFHTAKTEINLGVSYASKSNFTKALEVYYKALGTLEELKENKVKAIVLGNIGTIHYSNRNFEKAIEFSERAMKLDEENKNEAGVARHLSNIGGYYLDLGGILEAKGKNDEAIEKYKAGLAKLFKASEMLEEQGNRPLMATCLGNISNAYSMLGDTAKSIHYSKEAYKLDEELDNKAGMARHLGNIGWAYYLEKNYVVAEDYFKKALKNLEGISEFSLLDKWNDDLSKVYEAMDKPALALYHYKQSVKYRDSTFSIENAKKNLETEMNFEFEKKEAVAREENARQALIRNVFIGGFVVMLIMALLILRGYSIKRRSNQEISRQKELLETKNKEITDSIHYANRIQKAHLPNEDYISRKLKSLKKNS